MSLFTAHIRRFFSTKPKQNLAIIPYLTCWLLTWWRILRWNTSNGMIEKPLDSQASIEYLQSKINKSLVEISHRILSICFCVCDLIHRLLRGIFLLFITVVKPSNNAVSMYLELFTPPLSLFVDVLMQLHSECAFILATHLLDSTIVHTKANSVANHQTWYRWEI